MQNFNYKFQYTDNKKGMQNKEITKYIYHKLEYQLFPTANASQKIFIYMCKKIEI